MVNSTGISRRIDDLGRIVIPKEMRRKHRINEGDLVEIGEGENCITLQKYSPLMPFAKSADKVLQSFYGMTRLPIILCDTYNVISNKSIRELKGKEITDELYECILKHVKKSRVHIVKGYALRCMFIEEIIVNGKIVGALIIPETTSELTPQQEDCLKLCAKIIGSLE